MERIHLRLLVLQVKVRDVQGLVERGGSVLLVGAFFGRDLGRGRLLLSICFSFWLQIQRRKGLLCRLRSELSHSFLPTFLVVWHGILKSGLRLNGRLGNGLLRLRRLWSNSRRRNLRLLNGHDHLRLHLIVKDRHWLHRVLGLVSGLIS